MPQIRVEDLECFYEENYFGEPWAKEPQVVLLQTGYGANSAHFQTWVPGLSAHYRVLRRDAVGHGRTSTGQPDHDLSLEGLAQDVVSFLDAMDLESVHYVGERTGAMTGVVLGALFPTRIRSLGLFGCPIRCGEGLQKAMHQQLPSDLQAKYSGWNDAMRGLGGAFAWHDEVKWLEVPGDPVQSQWQRDQLHLCDEGVLERYAAATMDFDIEQYLPEVDQPTLVFAPTNTYRTTLGEQVAMRSMVRHGEIEVIEGGIGRADDGSGPRCANRLLQFWSDHFPHS